MSDSVMRVSSEMAALTPEVWSALIYPALLENLVFNDTVAHDYEGDIRALGDTVNISTIPQFPIANDLTEGAKNDAAAVTVVGSQLVINHELCTDFILTKRVLVQSINAQDKLRDHAVYSIGKAIESIILADIAPSTASPDHVIAFTSSTTLAFADVLAAKRLLDAQSVPDMGQRVLACGTGQKVDLLSVSGFVSRDFVPNTNALESGDIPTPVAGFRVKASALIGDRAFFYDPMFMQVAIQRAPEVELFPLGADGTRGLRVNVTALMGDKQLSNLRVVQMG